MHIPPARDYLPEMIPFIEALAADVHAGTLTSWRDYVPKIREFYTPERMDQVETVLPGWKVMASHWDGTTLFHVSSVLTALYLLPEYERATPEQRLLMEWIVLFHDIAKIAKKGTHDFVHGFRSAAIAGRALGQIGFATTAAYPAQIDAWVTLTHNAVKPHATEPETIQDNSKLPQILAGLDALYGADTPAIQVTKGVLLHMSLDLDPDYPTLAPLTDAEIDVYIEDDFMPLLEAMMLADMGGWNLFDADGNQHYRDLITGYMGGIRERRGA